MVFSSKKSILVISLSLCLIYTVPVQAEPSFTKKYVPYLGYEGGYTNYHLITNRDIKKYTPRFFVGLRPVQKKDYQIGFEFGYTLPATFEENRYDYNEHFKLNEKNMDLFLTFRQQIAGKFYWFLNPGLEYIQRDYKMSDSYFSKEESMNSLFISTRAGIGYNIKDGFSTNLFIKSRFHDFEHANISQRKSLIKLNIQYTF